MFHILVLVMNGNIIIIFTFGIGFVSAVNDSPILMNS